MKAVFFLITLLFAAPAFACSGAYTTDCPAGIQNALDEQYEQGRQEAEARASKSKDAESSEVESLRAEIASLNRKLNEQKESVPPGPVHLKLLEYESKYPAMMAEVQKLPNIEQRAQVIKLMQSDLRDLQIEADAEDDVTRYKMGHN